MNPRLSLSIIPVLVFYVAYRFGPPWVAILASFVTGAIVYWYTRQDRIIGLLGLLGFIFVSLGAIAGLITNSETVYLASGPAGDFIFAGVYIVSIFIGQPLIGGIARELVPTIAGRIPVNHSVYVKLSLLWAVFNFGQGVARIFMLREWSTGEYLLWSRVLNMPTSGLMILVSAILVYRAVVRHAAENGEPPPPTVREYFGLDEPAPAAAEAAE